MTAQLPRQSITVQGIFKGEHHPFEKTPEKKLNPLQQVTYFGLLNVLLPLQGITGILMWGVQRWPSLANAWAVCLSLPQSIPSGLAICLLHSASCLLDHNRTHSCLQPGSDDHWLGRDGKIKITGGLVIPAYR